MNELIGTVSDFLGNINWHALIPSIEELKAIPFIPFYLLEIIIASIGTGLQAITGGLVTDEMIQQVIHFVIYIGSFFVIK